jgi:hypothetical protein
MHLHLQIVVRVCYTVDSQNSAYVMTPNCDHKSHSSTLNVANNPLSHLQAMRVVLLSPSSPLLSWLLS